MIVTLTCFACGRHSTDGPAPGTVFIPSGTYRLGSDSTERARGYELSPPAVRQAGWYEAWELAPYEVRLEGFWIDSTPVTHRSYAEFVAATRHRVPQISESEYSEQGFLVHAYEEVLPFLWTDGAPNPTMHNHPVALVSREDAAAYCEWRGGRLPTEHEWEAACRGQEGRTFPWGTTWRGGIAHMDTTFTAPVSAHTQEGTPNGILDLIGNVFEWTDSPFGEGRTVLKGCSWDDAPGTCRCAFRHGRLSHSRHILIGFRCVR
jgi:formylglycine-generating enzyme required for sulfatase activity